MVRLGRSVHVDVVRELTSTERRVLQVLHARPVRIRVRIDRENVVQPIGVGGETHLNTSVDIGVDPDALVGPDSMLRLWLPFVLAHELSHSVRDEGGPGLTPRMLDYFVDEGVAEAFSAAMFPTAPTAPELMGLTQGQLRSYWHRARGILYSNPDQRMRNDWLFRGDNFPRHTVYAIGTALIRSFRGRHPPMSWAKLTRLDSETILEMSHFHP